MGGCVIDRVGKTADGQERLHTSNIGQMRTSLGGVARNVAENLARLGIGAELLSLVGDDPEGREILAGSRRAGIGMHRVAVVPNAATASYTAIFNGDGELVIGLADMAVFDGIAPCLVEEALAATQDDTLLFADANLPAAALLAVAAGKKARTLAAAPVSRQKLARLTAILPDIDILFLNRYEAATLLGRSDDDAGMLARRLAEGSVGRGLLTLGPNGAIAWEAGEVTNIPALAAQPLNVNGAGDALAAATLARLACGDDFVAAARRAMAAAALTVETQQAVRADLTMDAVLARSGVPPRTETTSS